MEIKKVEESWFWLKQNVDILIRYGIKHHEINEGDEEWIMKYVQEVDEYFNQYSEEDEVEKKAPGYTDYGYIGEDGIERVNDYETEEK